MGVKGYKAFHKGMICKDKKYEENTTYEEKGHEICEPGVMHFCENPFDVLDYYPLVDSDGAMSEFAEVETLGDVYKTENKSASNKLHIGTKLNFKGFIKACVEFTLEKTKFDSSNVSIEENESGYYAKIGSSGDSAQITSEGTNSIIMAAGYNSIAKGKVGSWITLAEWVKTDKQTKDGFAVWKPVCVKTEHVDGNRIKEDTFYKLVNGEFKEIER